MLEAFHGGGIVRLTLFTTATEPGVTLPIAILSSGSIDRRCGKRVSGAAITTTPMAKRGMFC
jgi:hypothetical protein